MSKRSEVKVWRRETLERITETALDQVKAVKKGRGVGIYLVDRGSKSKILIGVASNSKAAHYLRKKIKGFFRRALHGQPSFKVVKLSKAS